LREVQVSYTEFRSLYVDGKEYFAATTEVLDIAVPTMLRATCGLLVGGLTEDKEVLKRTWNSSGTFSSNLSFDMLVGTTSVHILRIWRLGNNSI
jgi:hypothetical protein